MAERREVKIEAQVQVDYRTEQTISVVVPVGDFARGFRAAAAGLAALAGFDVNLSSPGDVRAMSVPAETAEEERSL